ncbi:MAG: hypothetical protein ABSG89_05420 [Bacteroidales bacterium]|jgi:hypothetical protein
MKTQAYKTGIALLTSIFLFSSAVEAQEEVTKEFHKEYTAKQGASLDLNNRYGDIVIQTSESDQVVINVKVTVKYPDREKAEKLLGYIDVVFNEENNYFSAKTTIDDKFSFTGWNDSKRFSIDYDVKMPGWMNLTLVNKYGNTNLDDISGSVDLDIKYGNLTASKLTRGNEKPFNTLNIAYGKASIDEAGWLDATVRYSGNFSISKCQALLLDSRYSADQFGTVSSIVGETKYDKVNIDEINNLVLEAGYSGVYVGTLTKKLEFSGGYGSLNVDKVPAGFESIKTDTHYMGVKVAIDESASYSLESHMSYASLKFNEDNFRNQKRIIENTSSEISGIVGKESEPTSTVSIESSYGGVRLY